TPDPSFFCLTSAHWWVLSGLYTGILKHNGLLMLTGVPGAGKSLVVCCLMKLLESNNVAVEYLASGNVLPLRVNLLPAPYSHSTDELVQALKRLERAAPAVLFVDDCENLSKEAWRDLQLFATKPQADRHRVIVIVGRPEVEDALASPDLSELEQA